MENEQNTQEQQNTETQQNGSEQEQSGGKSELQSFFEQQGLTEDEMKQAAAAFKSERDKANNKPDESKPDIAALTAQNEQYKQAALKAQVESKASLAALQLGADVNTLPYILKLADFKDAVKSDGTINEEKLKAAVNKVFADIPALKKAADDTGFKLDKLGADNNNENTANQTEKLKKIFGL